ncbi:MAG: Fic family protein [Nocardioides sp.]
MSASIATRDWVPHRTQTQPWRQRTVRGPRADRLLREVSVSLPPMIADLDLPMERSLATMASASAGTLSHLDLVHGRTLAELNHLQLRTEAIDSSKIEDVDASLTDYGRALLGVGANASAVSMASATGAMTRLIADAERTRRIRSEAVLEAHHDLFARHPDEAHRAGRYRTTQNWIGGSDYSPRNALYVPPPPATVPDYLADLFVFANRQDIAPLAQAAIAHAQFESIHPFIDGNGRIGRALIHAILRRRRITRHLTIPIASALVADRDRYFAALHDYRDGCAQTIVALLASAASIAAAESWTTATQIVDVRARWGDLVGGTRPGTGLHRLLDLLTEEPIVNLDLIVERLGVDDGSAAELVDRLVGARVLRKAPRSRRSPVWLATDILDEIRDLSVRIQASRLRTGTRR